MEKCREQNDVHKCQTKDKNILWLYFILCLIIGSNYQAKITLLISHRFYMVKIRKKAFCLHLLFETLFCYFNSEVHLEDNYHY